MGTPSKIILKLRKEDIGKKVKFDESKLPIPLSDWIFRDVKTNEVWLNQKGKDMCCGIVLKGEYIGIYCHWDGDLDGVGKALTEKFNSYESALNLIVGGFCSEIASGRVAHYANRNNGSWTKWKDIKPIQGSLEFLQKKLFGYYEYVFEDGKWRGRKS